MILARFIGVPARMVRNEQHAFCEVPSQNDSGQLNWHRFDLGGAPTVDLTPADRRKNIFDHVAPISKKLEKTEGDPIEDSWEESYFNQYTSLIEKNKLKSISQILEENSPLSPLIELLPNQDLYEVNKQILQTLRENNIDTYSQYIYIHSPEDFSRYLKPYYLEQGQRKQKDGPLKDVITNGGVIVINWSNFTPSEMASYKSILDANPTLLGIEVSKETTVIGITKKISRSPAVLSRCQRFILDDDFFKQAKVSSQPIDQTIPIEVDLFNRPNWKEDLFGKIIFKDDQILFEDGPLLQAIEQNRPLVINNPPQNNDDFTLLLHRLTVERKIFHNGKLYEVPEKLTVKLDSKTHTNSLFPYVSLVKATPYNRKRVYIGMHNLNDCFEQLHFDSAKKAHTLPGLFNEHEDSVFYLTDSITESDWQHLLAYIQKNYPGKNFYFQLAPNVSIKNVIKFNESLPASEMQPANALKAMPSVVYSNDPDYYCVQLQRELATNNDPLLVDITPQTSFSDLIYETSITPQKEDTTKVDFACIEKGVLKALRDGRTVILNGDLSPALYQRLLPLLTANPPHIICNGERIEVKGRLISVQNKKPQSSPVSSVTVNYTRDDYKKSLGIDGSLINEKIFKNLCLFVDLAQKMPHQGLGRPEQPTMTQARFKHMFYAIKNGKLHAHNPIKGMLHYDYPKDSEEYAYLNVIAKNLLSLFSNVNSEVRVAKLTRLLKQHNIKTKDDLSNHYWKVLNCWNSFPGRLDELINQTTLNEIPQHFLDGLWNEIQPYIGLSISETKKRSHVDKRMEQLNTLLQDTNSNFIILKGPPGVGKTHTFRQVLKDRVHTACYESNDEILTWLEDRTDQIKVLLLDEANMQAPGTWDFLKGVSRDKKTVYYKDKEYSLTNNHKIIMTGNPETFPQRYYHSLFQHYGDTLLFKMPEDDYLEKMVLKSILEPHALYTKNITEAMLFAYDLIIQYNPYLPLSTRDLESLAQRYITLAKEHSDGSMHIMWDACVGEFAGAILETEKRERFISELADKFNLSKQEFNENDFIQITPSCLIPQEKAYLVRAIEQDLQIRDRFNQEPAEHDSETFYKQGVIIEGDAGLGKSTLFQAILEKHGFSKDSTDTQKKYYEVSLGDKKTVETILLKAYLHGSAVILDELNLAEKEMESIEKLINQLLTVKDVTKLILDDSQKEILNILLADVPVVNGKPRIKPGFMLFTSQNPGYFEGTKPLSPALCNRLHMLYMDQYSEKAMIAMANARNKPYPKALIRAGKRIKAKWGDISNTRTFYTIINSDHPTKPKKSRKHSLDTDHVTSKQSGAKKIKVSDENKNSKKRAVNTAPDTTTDQPLQPKRQKS